MQYLDGKPFDIFGIDLLADSAIYNFMTYIIVQEVAYAICKKTIEKLDDTKLIDEQVKLTFLDMESLFKTPFGKDSNGVDILNGEYRGWMAT